jgi:HK97 family phage prohead protease
LWTDLPGCLDASLASGATVSCLWSHDWTRSYGTTADGALTVAADDFGLFVALRPRDDDAGRGLVEAVRSGAVGGMSNDCVLEDIERRPWWPNGIVAVRQAALREVSFVEAGANYRTRAAVLQDLEQRIVFRREEAWLLRRARELGL